MMTNRAVGKKRNTTRWQWTDKVLLIVAVQNFGPYKYFVLVIHSNLSYGAPSTMSYMRFQTMAQRTFKRAYSMQ